VQHDGPSRLGYGVGVDWNLQYGSSHRQPENISIDDSPEHQHSPDVKQAHAMLESASLCIVGACTRGSVDLIPFSLPGQNKNRSLVI